jgi:hypothetical protein
MDYWFYNSTVPYSRFSVLIDYAVGRPDSTQKISTFMLQLLEDSQVQYNKKILELERKIINACDVQTLWFLRSDWMQCLAYNCGEQASIAHIRSLDALFKDKLPDEWFSRPSRLA